MILPKHIDLHMHSTVSDGTDAPLELLERVRESGIDMFALTDHDAIAGCETISYELENGTDDEPFFLPGVEFSCEDELGQYHILGYGYDPDHKAVRAVVNTSHALRMRKLDGRINFLKEHFGFTFSDEDLAHLKGLHNPGKPHLANLMVRYGYAESKEQGIREFINKTSFETSHIRPEMAIRGILDAGGIPVLAHPSYGNGDDLILGDEMDERIRHLLEMGLEGLEAYYYAFTPKLVEQILGLAKTYDLYVTAGSDYHGRNKLVPLGETALSDTDEAAEGLVRFLERVLEKC